MIPLTLRSHHSLMWGTASPPELCCRAKHLGYTRIALTDTDNLYGLWPFLAACKEFDLRPIIGAEVTDRASHWRAVCLVKTKEGYSNLCRLLTRRHRNKAFSLKQAVPEFGKGLVILTQSPVYWFGAPWIYKKYIDEVFTTGLVQQNLVVDDGRTRKDPDKQYGTGGKMQGKKYMLSLTWNAPEATFGDKDQLLLEGRTVDDAFIANTTVYKFCGAEIVPSFSCYDVLKNAEVEGDIKRLKAHLSRHFAD